MNPKLMQSIEEINLSLKSVREQMLNLQTLLKDEVINPNQLMQMLSIYSKQEAGLLQTLVSLNPKPEKVKGNSNNNSKKKSNSSKKKNTNTKGKGQQSPLKSIEDVKSSVEEKPQPKQDSSATQAAQTEQPK